jgi:aryl-alcohol dehydrogenase-like predicted oxidoreductase
MRYKLLGKSGLRVSELCLGTMTFMEGLSWGASRQENRQIFDEFMAAGGNFIDTANSYGTSEEYLGEFMGGDRDRVVIGTKYTGRFVGSNLPKDANGAGNHRKNMVQSVEASLKRLKTDYLDLLWVHAWDFMTPVEEVMRGLDDLVRRGKVHYVGISNVPAWVAAQANMLADLRGWTPFIGLQVEYNLIQRDAERELLPMARALELGVTAWTPLASGWLTGKYSRNVPPRLRNNMAGPKRLDDLTAAAFVRRTARNVAIVEEVIRISTELGSTPAHVALNWLRQQGMIPIMGVRKVEQLKENLACLSFELSEQQMRRLDEASRIELGYPHDFLATGMVRQHIYGGMFDLIDSHRSSKMLVSNRTATASTRSRKDAEAEKESEDYLEEFVN